MVLGSCPAFLRLELKGYALAETAVKTNVAVTLCAFVRHASAIAHESDLQQPPMIATVRCA
jgi:hypothetical protein